jgi:molecular chaperone GrpE
MMEHHKDKHVKHEHNADSPAQPAVPETADETVTIPAKEYAQLQESCRKAEEAWDKMLRMQADLENTRKRLERDKAEFVKYANEKVLLELLHILDDLERVVAQGESKNADMPTFIKGVEMILAHLYELLKSHGVTPMNAQGKAFDPNLHEPLMQQEDNGVAEHTILEELQKGYRMFDRVLRTAKVKVSKKTNDQGPGS